MNSQPFYHGDVDSDISFEVSLVIHLASNLIPLQDLLRCIKLGEEVENGETPFHSSITSRSLPFSGPYKRTRSTVTNVMAVNRIPSNDTRAPPFQLYWRSPLLLTNEAKRNLFKNEECLHFSGENAKLHGNCSVASKTKKDPEKITLIHPDPFQTVAFMDITFAFLPMTNQGKFLNLHNHKSNVKSNLQSSTVTSEQNFSSTDQNPMVTLQFGALLLHEDEQLMASSSSYPQYGRYIRGAPLTELDFLKHFDEVGVDVDLEEQSNLSMKVNSIEPHDSLQSATRESLALKLAKFMSTALKSMHYTDDSPMIDKSRISDSRNKNKCKHSHTSQMRQHSKTDWTFPLLYSSFGNECGEIPIKTISPGGKDEIISPTLLPLILMNQHNYEPHVSLDLQENSKFNSSVNSLAIFQHWWKVSKAMIGNSNNHFQLYNHNIVENEKSVDADDDVDTGRALTVKDMNEEHSNFYSKMKSSRRSSGMSIPQGNQVQPPIVMNTNSNAEQANSNKKDNFSIKTNHIINGASSSQMSKYHSFTSDKKPCNSRLITQGAQLGARAHYHGHALARKKGLGKRKRGKKVSIGKL